MQARVQNLIVLKKENPDLSAIVEDLLKNRAKQYSFLDETLKGLTVKARAEFMLDHFKKLPKSDRAPQWEDWKRKKIMTDAVEDELKELLRAAGALPTSN